MWPEIAIRKMFFHVISVFQLYVWAKIEAALILFSINCNQLVKRRLQLDLAYVKICSIILSTILICFLTLFSY